jgi:hypothetical protein
MTAAWISPVIRDGWPPGTPSRLVGLRGRDMHQVDELAAKPSD